MSRPNLMHADTLCWIAKLGTFSAAAERMHTTQPAISARMKELEVSLGFALFEKRGRRLELTLQARRFVERVEPLLRSVEDAFNDADSVVNPSGTVRLGLGEVSMTWLGKLMPALRKSLPRVTYDVELDLGVKLQEQLVAGTLDAAIVANSRSNPELVYTPLGSVPMIWVCATRLLFTADGRKRSLDDLLRYETLWCVSKPSDFFAPAYQELRSFGADMTNLCTCNKLMGLIQIVASGGGIALLPKMMISEHLQSGQLAMVPGSLTPQSLDFAVAVHRHQSQSAVHRLIAELLRLSETLSIGN
ncbi:MULTISPECIES: LysR family transcriptional regulator [Comamonas]|uniref:LysR family transcriptional regulator n=1 Tax=Comamonas TaxID=283 RepID=UPI0005100851|nr:MULTISPECIES: LysR family transcriptional regulator [Comamonas]KGG85024.1 LysR family transcriptional regulator [Comamonas thiooxydans]KGG95164.1 LysR family transcriptional regulator [Comamonas thiooxydans]KGG96776.1 LysR family transcriptional regulator [Comamonas thiooxydans]KGH06146.1 LysR family transcriptional regulator [Comamonas thiooxydans]TZG08195.1 LysR family transcriptional regulator [Comamonas thiooxydans]